MSVGEKGMDYNAGMEITRRSFMGLLTGAFAAVCGLPRLFSKRQSKEFSPADIEGLTHWYKPGEPGGTFVDSAGQKWARDWSGNGNHAKVIQISDNVVHCLDKQARKKNEAYLHDKN
jgi:hypothetical protein